MELSQAEQLALSLMSEYHLIDSGWKFEWSSAYRQFGVCRYRTQTIALSHRLTESNSEEEVRNTILHEIAHAFAEGDGHGAEWKKIAAEIGCRPERCYSNSVQKPYPLWEARCTYCGTIIHAYRRRANNACSSCCDRHNKGKYTPMFQLAWTKLPRIQLLGM